MDKEPKACLIHNDNDQLTYFVDNKDQVYRFKKDSISCVCKVKKKKRASLKNKKHFELFIEDGIKVYQIEKPGALWTDQTYSWNSWNDALNAPMLSHIPSNKYREFIIRDRFPDAARRLDTGSEVASLNFVSARRNGFCGFWDFM